jgi:UDP:flavonoid glycosyltransferase YjiC (YdhE family)
VNLCAGHNVSPRPDFYEMIERDLVVAPSEECLRAVEELKQRDGLRQMSSLGYISTLSPDLNLYCEPQEFLSPAERELFAPIAFFGSLESELLVRSASDRAPRSCSTSPTAHIYISFGTVIWRHFEALALRMMTSIVDAVAEMESTSALLSLGGADVSPEARKTLERNNVRVEHYVDQAVALRESDLFITHHGLNSTHEAILYQVPMLSYPFLWDQPGLAQRCQELGIAVALTETLRGEPGSDEIRSTIERTFAGRPAMHAQLEAALSWEHQVEAERGAVLDRIVALERR